MITLHLSLHQAVNKTTHCCQVISQHGPKPVAGLDCAREIHTVKGLLAQSLTQISSTVAEHVGLFDLCRLASTSCTSKGGYASHLTPWLTICQSLELSRYFSPSASWHVWPFSVKHLTDVSPKWPMGADGEGRLHEAGVSFSFVCSCSFSSRAKWFMFCWQLSLHSVELVQHPALLANRSLNAEGTDSI